MSSRSLASSVFAPENTWRGPKRDNVEDPFRPARDYELDPASSRLRTERNGLREGSDGRFVEEQDITPQPMRRGAQSLENSQSVEERRNPNNRAEELWRSNIGFQQYDGCPADKAACAPELSELGRPLDDDGHPLRGTPMERELSSTILLGEMVSEHMEGQHGMPHGADCADGPDRAPATAFETQLSQFGPDDGFRMSPHKMQYGENRGGVRLHSDLHLTADLPPMTKYETQVPAGDGSSIAGSPQIRKKPEGVDRYYS